MADDEVVAAEEAVFGGEDRLDIADRIAASSYHMDSLAQKVVQRGEEWHRLNQQSPFIRTNPVSVLNGILGNQIILESGQQGDVANWEGDDAETGPVTVVLGPSNQTLGPMPQTSPARAYAIVRFGTKGFSTAVEVDVGLGCQFTVNASAVRVTIVMPTALSGHLANRIPVTGMLSFRAPLRTTPITRTIYWDDPIIQPNEARILVPPFAKKMTVVTQWTTPYKLTVFDTTGALARSWGFDRAASTEFPTVILPGDAAFVAVKAADVLGIQNLKFVFELAVG
jgi:hypothetical protein